MSSPCLVVNGQKKQSELLGIFRQEIVSILSYILDVGEKVLLFIIRINKSHFKKLENVNKMLMLLLVMKLVILHN